jgi:hypothetical protein
METIKNSLEKTFRESTSSDELFDAFQKSLLKKLNDVQLYKILLGNIILTTDEIKMYTEKICLEFPELSFEIYLWTGSILESEPTTDNLDSAYKYYKKAIITNPSDHQPYKSIIKMYNFDLDFPTRQNLELLFKKGINEVKVRSKLCKDIAGFYDKLDEPALKKKYLGLAAQFVKIENRNL